MTNKELYSQFVAEEKNLPIYMQPWWLDAVCAGKQWDVMLVNDNSGQTVAAMPYLLRKRSMFRYVLVPQQTQISGVWVAERVANNPQMLRHIAVEIKKFLQTLKLSYYYQQYPIESLMPEQMKSLGFGISRRVTYRVPQTRLQDLDALLDSFSKNKKRQLQKALTLKADTQMNIEDFYRFCAECMKEKGERISFTREFLLVLYQKTQRLQQSQLLRIQTADGITAAASLLLWDNNSMYFFFPCFSMTYKDAGANTLLAWEALKTAHEKNLSFDFVGSMKRSWANEYKQFGAEPTPYFAVRKYYNPLFAFALLINKFR